MTSHQYNDDKEERIARLSASTQSTNFQQRTPNHSNLSIIQQCVWIATNERMEIEHPLPSGIELLTKGRERAA